METILYGLSNSGVETVGKTSSDDVNGCIGCGSGSGSGGSSGGGGGSGYVDNLSFDDLD